MNEETHPRTGGPVIVGVDGSDASYRALEWAASEARLRGLALEAVIVWDYPTSYGLVPPLPAGIDFETAATHVLDEAVTAVTGEDRRLSVERRVVQGHPRQVLRDESHRASVLVVGNRGHGGVAGLLLGSVSEYLAAHAQCPVVIVHGGHEH